MVSVFIATLKFSSNEQVSFNEFRCAWVTSLFASYASQPFEQRENTQTIVIDLSHYLLLALIIMFVGIMIGAIGVGGVLLVPALIHVAGIEIHIAIAACMFSYAFSGAVGATIYARQGTIRWATGLWLCLGAMPGAYLGAFVVSGLALRTITLVIALFVVLAGLHAMRDSQNKAHGHHIQSKILLVLIGIIVGFGSAISGTGGPLLLVPLLVSMNWPALTAVGLSQVIQLPIAALATLGNYLHGEVDVKLGLGIAMIMVIGVAIGARLAHRVPGLLLRRVVAVVLLAVGASMLWQQF